MVAAANKHDDLVLRRIDVKSWSSPVAKQYRIRSLPTVRLYDGRGKLILDGPAVYTRVRAWKPAKRETARKQKTRSKLPGSTTGTTVVRRSRFARRIRLVSKHGEKVDFERELTPGSYTLFEFYADWCSESGKRAPELQSAVKRTNDLVLCRIRVDSMKSPVARQHKVKSLPHFVLFDTRGEFVKQGPAVIEDILQWKKFKAARPQR